MVWLELAKRWTKASQNLIGSTIQVILPIATFYPSNHVLYIHTYGLFCIAHICKLVSFKFLVIARANTYSTIGILVYGVLAKASVNPCYLSKNLLVKWKLRVMVLSYYLNIVTPRCFILVSFRSMIMLIFVTRNIF